MLLLPVLLLLLLLVPVGCVAIAVGAGAGAGAAAASAAVCILVGDSHASAVETGGCCCCGHDLAAPDIAAGYKHKNRPCWTCHCKFAGLSYTIMWQSKRQICSL